MEKHYRNFGKAMLLALSISTTAQIHSQENSTYSLSLENSKQFSRYVRDCKIYPVIQKEIEYYPLEKGQVTTREYNIITEQLKQYQNAYDNYNNKVALNKEKREAIDNINRNIDTFLNSDAKYEDKEKYLIDAQNSADKYKISARDIMLYQTGKKTKKEDLLTYQKIISSLKIEDYPPSWEYQQYVEIEKRASKVRKTEMGEVLSDKLSKRLSYMIDEKAIDLNTLSGTFSKLPDDYVLIMSDVDGLFLKNELTIDLLGKPNKGVDQRYPLIQNTDTKQLYYVMSVEFLPTVSAIMERGPIIQSLHKSGYQEYEKGGELYVKSKTAEIKLDAWTFNELKRDPSYITKFDNDQTQVASLVKQTSSHSKSLDKFINLYNIKRNKMPATDIAAWRTATINAKKLNDQIYKLNKKYQGNYSFRLFDQSDNFQVFLDNLRASQNVLGI